MRQSEALDILKLGHNVFLTGAAGSGKTHVLLGYIAYLREHDVAHAVTASTGIAATHLGGVTIHSWSAIGVRDALTDGELDHFAEKSKRSARIRDARVLIIDEISMLHSHQLDLVDRVCRRVRERALPFGGLQAVLCGDFFQLPPVSRYGEPARYASYAEAWRRGEFLVCYLTEQHRQGDDPLLAVLGDIRAGTAGEHTKVPLRTCYKRAIAGGITPTKLYTHNADVDAINARELAKLAGESERYTMVTVGRRRLVETLKASCLASETLELKRDAAVMFVKNNPDGSYVNGTLGRVKAFAQKSRWPIVETAGGRNILAAREEWRLEEDGRTVASIEQVPLRLAWAITVHKSQGMTLDSAEIDLSRAFEPGMGYVALSRVRSLAGLRLMGLNETALEVNPDVLAQDAKLRALSEEAARVVREASEEYKRAEQERVLREVLDGQIRKKPAAASSHSRAE
jgi:ATP-dependent exoDNAse (exonuclease V) alpha subunit